MSRRIVRVLTPSRSANSLPDQARRTWRRVSSRRSRADVSFIRVAPTIGQKMSATGATVVIGSRRPGFFRGRPEEQRGEAMKRFMFLHYGFETPTPEIEEAWGNWFASIADKMVDSGSPFKGGREVSRNGTKDLPLGMES